MAQKKLLSDDDLIDHMKNKKGRVVAYFYYKDGKKYAHTIDPKTGYPIQHNILSATVIGQQCAVADAYATAFMVMGLDGAKKVLERHPELMAYFIYSDNNGKNAVWFSPSLEDKIEK